MEDFINQSLLTAMNCKYTGREAKAHEIISQVKKICPDNTLVEGVWEFISLGKMYLPEIVSENIGSWWHGDWSVCDRSIQVVCDHGIGDTLNTLRYVKKLKKERTNCRVIVNCYAYYNELKRLMDTQDYIDEFVMFHKKCDYYTNILSLPVLLQNGKWKNSYPISFNEILEFPIPDQPLLNNFESRLADDGEFKVGLAWHSNMENAIGLKKSISINSFAALEDGTNQIFSLLPTKERTNFVTRLPIDDLYDTASIIAGCDVVVSVDTAVLHLAGSMGKKTLGLLPHEADARWALGETTVWYPSVELFRQGPDMDWGVPIAKIKERLVELRNIR